MKMDTGTGFSPTPVNRLRQQIEEQIRLAVTTGQLVQGQRLPSESALSEMFGVSRATIREALRSLVATGLIFKTPGAAGGSFVRTMGPDELAERFVESMRVMVAVGSADRTEVSSVRELLEIPAARLAALNRTEKDIEMLEQVLESEKHASVDAPGVPILDVQFHTAVARASNNVILTALIGALHLVAQPVRKIPLSAESAQQAVRQHAAIVRSIKEADPDAAELAIRQHLTYLAKIGDHVPPHPEAHGTIDAAFTTETDSIDVAVKRSAKGRR
jgi:GntR family transcriptional regulator, transcriptional repressor for pyruvate dehydrogenase complex